MAILKNTVVTGSIMLGPSNESTGSLGNIYYKNSTCRLTYVSRLRSWSTGNSLGTPRYNIGGAGIQDAALAFGGRIFPPGTVSDSTETYDGTTWSDTGHTLQVSRHHLAGAGTQGAALAFGGCTPSVVQWSEAYDGLGWSLTNPLVIGRGGLSGGGLEDAAWSAGGSPSSTCAETYNGTTWNSISRLIYTKSCGAGAGTTDNIVMANTSLECTEIWDGTAWYSATISNSRGSCAHATGVQNAALKVGGASPANVNEEFNGTTWKITAYNNQGHGIGSYTVGTQSAALAFCCTKTEEYSENIELKESIAGF